MLPDLRYRLAERSQRRHRMGMNGNCGRCRLRLVLQQFRLELAMAVDDLLVELRVAGGAEAVQQRRARVYAGDGFGAKVVQGWNSGVVMIVVEH